MDLCSDKNTSEEASYLPTEHEAIYTRLDYLLVSYLDLIDTYTQLQSDISHSLSNGYMAIAQANFSSASGPRYGQDFYHGRMQAMRGVEISYENTMRFPNFRLKHFPLEEEDKEIVVSEKDGSTQTSQVRRRKIVKKVASEVIASSAKTESGISRQDDAQTEEEHEEKEEKEKERSPNSAVKKDPRDPIKWFGILVPPALKDAQSKFSTTLDAFADLVTLLRNLDWHEEEIRKLRKQLGEEELHQTAEKLENVNFLDAQDKKDNL